MPSTLSKKRAFTAFISLWIQNLIHLYPHKVLWFSCPLVEEKHFWEFPFSWGRKGHTHLCSFSSLLSLLPPTPTPTPQPLQPKCGSVASDPLRRADVYCAEGVGGGARGSKCSFIFRPCRVLGCTSSFLTVSLDSSAFSHNKTNGSLFCKRLFSFMQSCLILAGTLNSACPRGWGD